MQRTFRLFLLTLFAGSATVSSQGWPPKIENLQVFPADMPVEQLIGAMRGFTFALGVRCQHCHVGEEGQRLSDFDFAVDQKPAKERAREMLRMTQVINAQHLAKLEGEKHGLEVACVTCHRGATRPEQLDQVLVRAVVEESVTAAVARYSALRDEYFGSGTFDFGEASLVRAADALLEMERTEDAARLLELNLEHHAESQWTAGSLAGVYEQLDRKAEALAIWRRLLESEPGNARIQQQIERLESGG